jgi:thiamine-phosphate pyrophosphorylase
VKLCLVSDRRQLAGAAAPPDAAHRCLLTQIRYAVEAGIDLVQIRERDLEAAALARLVTAVLRLTRGSRTRVVVNDRLDVALACGADGVHLRGDSVSVAEARRLAPRDFLIGRSVHGVEGAIASAGADYLIAGTVCPTASKPATTAWLGADGLRAIVRAVPTPVLAIGGITEGRLGTVASTGAAGAAAIGLFMRADEPPGAVAPAPCRAIPLTSLAARLRSAFDSVNTAP